MMPAPNISNDRLRYVTISNDEDLRELEGDDAGTRYDNAHDGSSPCNDK